MKATTTRHNYSRWRRPGNLKTKTSVFEIYLFQIQTLSFEKLGTKFIVKIMFCGLRLFSCFSGGDIAFSDKTARNVIMGAS